MERGTKPDIVVDIRNQLDPTDYELNSTLQSLNRVVGQLETIYQHKAAIDTILDIGCGSGAFSAALGELLEVETVHGVDVDAELLDEATERGITAHHADVETDKLALDAESVDLVISFGLIEHLCYYDNCFEEVTRVLAPEGYLWLSTPNLGGWINRFALLTGHQPRNVELTRKRAVGTLPVYDLDEFIGHVHAPTYKALLELLELYGFDIHQTAGLRPYQRSSLVKLLDTVFGLRTSWSRRVAVLAQYSETDTH